MKVHTTEFKEQIKTLGRELDSIISFNGAELGVEELNSVTPYYEGNLLKSVMKQLDIDSNIEIPIGTEINYKFGVKVGDNYEYLDLGNYIVNEVEKQENTNSYIIKCYDKMLYSMVDYEKMNISYPISIRNYINAICEYLRLNFKNKNEEFVNYNKNIPNELYFDEDDKSLGYTFRDVLDELAEVTASTICVNNDELEIRYINDTKDTIDEEFLKNVNVNFGEKYGPINSIVLSRSAGSDNVYLQDENSINENGLTEIKITDNQIMNFNDRSEYLTDILDKLNGIEFYLNDFTSTGIVYYELCDSYNVQIGDNVYNCIMLNDEIKVTQGLVEEIFTERLNTSETDYSKSDKTDRKINQTNLIVDKQRGIIQGIVEKTDNNSSRITELEIADGKFSVQVSNIEKGIVETNKNVSSLQASLDNVSADFEDFKDNEFINSIGNLQDQIDGAIQFWNGEEIPTINNYPANEWTTEEERNNHRADIYTVIEDVDGELKQGKAYRFDKVDNIWQWIELTDNELSAVQAIAQEALDKSNKNIGDIQELVKKTSELSVKDEEITAIVEEINNKYEQDITLTKEANGNLVIVEDAGPYKLESIEIEGKSYQETRSGKNKLKYDDFESVRDYHNVLSIEDGKIQTSATGNYSYRVFKCIISEYLIGKEITLSFKGYVSYKGSSSRNRVSITNTDSADGRYYGYADITELVEKDYKITFTPESNEIYMSMYLNLNDNNSTIMYIKDVMLEEGSIVTEYEEYGATPSPDFPSEIKNVEGVTNLAIFNNAVVGNLQGDGILDTAKTAYETTDYIKVKPNTIYTYKVKNTYIPTSDTQRRCVEYNNSKEIVVVSGTIISSTIEYKSITFITSSTTEYVRLSRRTTDEEMMLFEGISKHFYIPYGSKWLELKAMNNILQDSAIELNGISSSDGANTNNTARARSTDYIEVEELWDYLLNSLDKTYVFQNIMLYDENKNYINYYSKTDANFPSNSEKVVNFPSDTKYIKLLLRRKDSASMTSEEASKIKVTLSSLENTALVDLNKKNLFNGELVAGYISVNAKTDVVTPDSNYSTTQKIYTNGATKLTFIKDTSHTKEVYLFQFDSNGNVINYTNTRDSVKRYDIATNTSYVRLRFDDNNTNVNLISKSIKLYEGIETDDYYRLASIGDTKDTFKDGVLTQRIGKFVLDGSESGWGMYKHPNHNIHNFYNNSLITFSEQKGYCDKLPIVVETGSYGNFKDTQLVMFNSLKGIGIYFDSNKMTTYGDFITWLSENPLTLYYPLATPIEHTLNYEVLELHEGYNSISTNDELEPDMSIAYLTDSKLNAKYATKGELKVTADSITSEINSTLKNGYTTIEQTNKIEQKITDTENEILIEVGKKVTQTDYNKDKENLQNDIDSKVGEEDFTGANILLAINGDESEAQINADKINLNGIVTANENFIISEDGSMKAKAGAFGAWNIDDDGNIYADRKVGNKIYRTYIQQANTADGGETWAFSTQVSEDDGQTFYYTSFITNDGELYAEKDIISTGGTVAGQHLTALDLTYNPEFIIPIYGETIQSGTVSLPTSQSTAVAAITIDPGKYLVVSQFQFSTNADGQRAVNVSTSSGATSIDITQRAPSGLQTRIRHVGYLTPTKQTTYYWNMYQTSGATLSGNVWIQLFRLQ